MTERLAKQMYDVFGDDLETIGTILAKRNFVGNNLEKIPTILNELLAKKK